MLSRTSPGSSGRRRLALLRGDAGITLTELLVTMTLMSIVGALSLSWFVGAGTTNARTVDAGQASAGARNAVTAWAGLLQVADSPSQPGAATDRISTLTPTSITFNADLTNLPTCSTAPCATSATTPVTLALVSTTSNGTTTNQLVQTITKGGAAQKLVQVLAGAAVAGTCLFQPYTAAGTALACSNLTVAQRASITRIDIAFTVTPPTGPVQSYGTSVAIPGSTS